MFKQNNRRNTHRELGTPVGKVDMYISIYGICILVTFKSIMDVEMTLSKCNFGETMGDECHKLSHRRIQGMEKLSDYCADMQEIFRIRAGMTLQQDKTNITICIHHSKMLSGVFE